MNKEKDKTVKYKNIIDHMLNGYARHKIVLDKNNKPVDYIFLEVNKAFTEMLKLKKDDVIGKKVTEAIPDVENDSTDWIGIYGGVALEDKEVSLERYSKRLGKWFKVNAYSTKKGQFVAVFDDITEIRKQAKILKEEIMLTEEAVKAGNVGLWRWDISADKVYYSDEWKAQIGYSPEEISDSFSEWEKRVHPDDIEDALKTVQETLDNAKDNYESEFRFRHKDGSYRWIRANAKLHKDSSGKPDYMIGAHVDITDEKKIEEKLIESQKFLKRTNKMAKVGGWKIIENFSKVFWSAETCRIHGVPEGYSTDVEEAINFFHPEDRDKVKKCVDKAINKGEKYEFTARLQSRNGKLKWVKSIGRPEKKDGKVIQVSGAIQDITDLKKIEEKLKESEQKFRNIFNNSAASIIIHDKDTGEIIDANKIAVESYGLNSLEELKKNEFWIEPPYSKEDALEKIHKAAKEGIINFEWKSKRKDGRMYWEEVQLKPIELEGKEYVIGAAIDITDKKKEEIFSKARLKVWQLAFEKTEDRDAWIQRILDVLGPALNVSRANFVEYKEEAHKEFYSPTVEWVAENAEPSTDVKIPAALTEWARKKNLRVIDPEKTYKKFPKVLKPLAKPVLDLVVKKLDIKYFWVFPIVIKDKVNYFLTFDVCRENKENPELTESAKKFIQECRNIIKTFIERQNREEEKELLQEQLIQSQKMESIGQLAGGIAHDFNNILTAIKGETELLLEDHKGESSIVEGLSMIENNTKRATELVKQLLVFSRKDIRKVEIFNVNKNLSDMVATLKRLIGENIELNTKISEKNIFIEADPSLFDQCIVNLIVNARDALKDTVSARIELCAGTKKIKEKVNTFLGEVEPGDYVYVKVKDNGCGMDKETQKKIFEPFFTTKGIGKGTGLGMSMIDGFLDSSGGSITVESSPGQGTAFELLFPSPEIDPEKYIEEQNLNKAKRYSEYTILIVDDDKNVRRVAKKIMNKLGFKVVVAGSVKEAKEKFSDMENFADLLFTDLFLGDGSGIKLYKNLIKNGKVGSVIVTSGYMPPDIKKEISTFKKGYFLSKPYEIAKLRKLLKEILES